MKRSREEKIMLEALQRFGYVITAQTKKAVADGLRQIRRERYAERMVQKIRAKRDITKKYRLRHEAEYERRRSDANSTGHSNSRQCGGGCVQHHSDNPFVSRVWS